MVNWIVWNRNVLYLTVRKQKKMYSLTELFEIELFMFLKKGFGIK